MTTLNWMDDPGGWSVAHGTDWTYLIAVDDRNVVLTRWEHDDVVVSAARQAALYAIQLGGAYDAVPSAAEGVTGHLKQAAQAYESGLDVPGHPAWRHGHQPG